MEGVQAGKYSSQLNLVRRASIAWSHSGTWYGGVLVEIQKTLKGLCY